MRIRIAIAWMTITCMGCGRAVGGQSVAQGNQPLVVEKSTQQIVVNTIGALSFENLAGTWLRLDSEGEIAGNGDRLVLSKLGDELVGILQYQSVMRKCRLFAEHTEYLLTAESGERYRINRLESINANENGGIGIDLIVGKGFDDIGLGSFQREDILKKLKGQ
jgi:hypothetical protein